MIRVYIAEEFFGYLCRLSEVHLRPLAVSDNLLALGSGGRDLNRPHLADGLLSEA